MEKDLIARIHLLQHSTVGKALRRVIQKKVTKINSTQTYASDLEEEMREIKDDMDRLYREKHLYKQDYENSKKEILKLKSEIKTLTNEISEVRKDNKLLGTNISGGQIDRRYEVKANDTDSTVLNKKIESYKEALK